MLTTPSSLVINSFDQVVGRALDKQVIAAPEIQRLLQTRLHSEPACEDFSTIWPLEAYQLAQVSLIQQATAESRFKIAAALAQQRLREAWGIENAGMTFAAKMSLLAESIETQQLYSLFAAEEARHLHLIQAILGPVSEPCQDAFIDWLRELIRGADRRPLLLMIQIVLEGWGLEHYTGMMRTCQSASLKAVFRQILSDEAIHHGSGLAQFREADLSREEMIYTHEALCAFLEMVRVGPVALLQCVTSHLDLTAAQQQRLLTEMGAADETRRKLKLLKHLLRQAGALQLLEPLELQHYFELPT